MAATIDEVLEILHRTGPDLLGGNSNHGPMVTETLFALGRTIGWIGHAIEQYQIDRIIRPRARYVGVPPK